MFNYEWQHDAGILVLHPEGPLEASDFVSISNQVDTYLAGHSKLHGILIHVKSFPGWKDFTALLAEVTFLKEHLKRIEKVAIVADGAMANIVPNIANHFVHAQVQHFEFMHEDAALEWLKQTDKMNPVT
jgi:tRNA U38,U39,U40 pseudouridine synthase TruA